MWKPSPFRYTLRTYRVDHLWFPASSLAIFIFLTVFMSTNDQQEATVRAYLGAVLPLLSGVLSAYALLEDPALELHFAAPRSAWQMLLERLGLVWAVVAVCALVYQLGLPLLGCKVDFLGTPLNAQLAWLVPTLVLSGLGGFSALATTHPSAGAVLVGILWLFQLLTRAWFLRSWWARYLLVFMGAFYPEHPNLHLNQAFLLCLAGLLLAASARLYRQQERYL